MADPALSSQKNHGGGNFLGENHGIMSGATHHVMRFTSSFTDRQSDFTDKKRIHCHGPLTQKDITAHGQPAPFSNFFRLSDEILYCLGSNPVQP